MEEGGDSIKDQVEDFLNSATFGNQFKGFFRKHCNKFEAREENKLEYTQLYQDFLVKFEDIINSFLKKKGSSRAEFIKQIHEAEESDEQYVGDRALLQQIVSVTSFQEFKSLMLQVKKDSPEEGEEGEGRHVMSDESDGSDTEVERKGGEEEHPTVTRLADEEFSQLAIQGDDNDVL